MEEFVLSVNVVKECNNCEGESLFLQIGLLAFIE